MTSVEISGEMECLKLRDFLPPSDPHTMTRLWNINVILATQYYSNATSVIQCCFSLRDKLRNMPFRVLNGGAGDLNSGVGYSQKNKCGSQTIDTNTLRQSQNTK